MKKVLIAHVSKQHSFHTAIALKRRGILFKYITTVYDKQFSLTMRAKKFLKGDLLKKANTRVCEELEENDVLQFYELLGLIRIIITKYKVLKFLKFDIFLMRLFSKKVARYAIKENVDAIIVYDGLVKKYLDEIKEAAPQIITIMDVSIAARPFMKETFLKDMQLYNHNSFYTEEKFLWHGNYMKDINNDFQNTDYFLVPSRVVRESLNFCGIANNKIIVVPYGVAIEQFNYVQKKVSGNPLKLLFVGNLSYRKGVHHLLNVISHYSKDEVIISLAGSYDPDGKLYLKYKDKHNIEFLGFVTRDIVAKVFQDADVFVMPTLGEGLALVILEALATGTPVICTEMAGGDDAIVDYQNGIVCKSSDRESLDSSIKWMIKNRDQIPAMSEKARKTAVKYTWDEYYRNLGNQLQLILERNFKE